VKREYEERRETLGQEQEEQREYLRGELERILQMRRSLNERCRQESDRLEELDFRVRVGEFAEEAVQEERKGLKEELLEITMSLADAQELVTKFEQVGLLAQAPMPAPDTDVGGRDEAYEDKGDFLVLEEDPSAADEDSPVVHCPSEAETGQAQDTPGADASISLHEDVFGYLVALDGSRQGERFPLISSELTVGSSPDIDIRLADSGIARVHARIVYKNRKHYIETMEEPGGCLVNGIQKDKAELKDGDVLSLGKVKMQVEYAREANA
jgi:hypothetical protein